jgi:hypothetical protein
MNRRHAALITLAGWILIQPPSIQRAGKLDISANALLFDWGQIQTFDTAAACEKDRQDVTDCGGVLNGDKQGTVVQACGYAAPSAGKPKTKDRPISSLRSQVERWPRGAFPTTIDTSNQNEAADAPACLRRNAWHKYARGIDAISSVSLPSCGRLRRVRTGRCSAMDFD